MTDSQAHTIGMRELRHDTGGVISRVRGGETIDVTDRGRLVARIVPVVERRPSAILDKLEAQGQLIRASRPGFLPDILPSDGTESLTDALQELREDRF